MLNSSSKWRGLCNDPATTIGYAYIRVPRTRQDLHVARDKSNNNNMLNNALHSGVSGHPRIDTQK